MMGPKPYLMRNTVGFGAGVGQLLGFHTYTTDGGRQWSVGVLWLTFRWSRQRPVWYRHLYARRRDEQDQRDGMLWLSDNHPHKIHAVPVADRKSTRLNSSH